MSYLSPNMNLLGITIGVDSGLTIEQNYNANVATLDGHNHASGSGVQINPAGLLINTDLPFGTNNATALRTARFIAQASALAGALDLGCIYVSGVDLWYNDVSGNQIQLTSGGLVNATSSGISSGSASATFISSVLTVLAASTTPANIKCASLLLGNNSAGTNYLTLAPPSSMASSFGLTLPSVPAAISLLQIDTSGNITGGQPLTNPSFPGKALQSGSQNVLVSNTNATNSLAIVRGIVAANATITSGEGFSVSSIGTGEYDLLWTTAFNTTSGQYPSVIVAPSAGGANQFTAAVLSTSSGGAVIQMSSAGAAQNIAFNFMAIGERA